MEFQAYHGCLEMEKKLGNTFLVTLTMELDTSIAEMNDKLCDTLNYQEVYDVVKDEMEKPSELIEHVARRIFDAIKQRFSQIQALKIELSKLNPPLGGKVERVKIRIDK
ncbi:MAG: dihydroneopterin aldolase [Bacteroidetes bacterium]|nr:dihydroneopterin aldolase [Bacteroidota bacterium]